MKHEWAIKGLILSVVIMCFQDMHWFLIMPWQLTVVLCLVVAFVVDRFFHINKDKS